MLKLKTKKVYKRGTRNGTNVQSHRVLSAIDPPHHLRSAEVLKENNPNSARNLLASAIQQDAERTAQDALKKTQKLLKLHKKSQ